MPQRPFGPLRSFGRIRGRALKPRQSERLQDARSLMLPDPAEGSIDPRRLAPEAEAVWLEVGFGGGEHLAEQAARHPEALLVGAEPFLNGVATAVRLLGEKGASNTRLHQGDVRDLLAALPEGCVDRVFILFPDPWPKSRHHKRRLVQEAFIADLARVLKPGGSVRFATDWADYADWTLSRFLASPDFRWTGKRADDWRLPPADHVTTRYEEKRLGDCAPVFLEFERP